MPKAEPVFFAPNVSRKHVINLAAVTSFTIVSHGFTYPFGTAFNRYQISKTKISCRNTFLKVVFLQQASSSMWEKVSSLYPGVYSAGFYKLLARTFKYCGQPLMVEFLDNQVGEKAKETFGDNSKPILQAAAGASIGILELPILHPLDTIKLKQQMGNINPFLKLIKTEKWALYNGWALAGIKNVLGLSTFFGVTSATRVIMFKENSNKVSLPNLLVASFVGATADTLVTNPINIIKKRKQVQSSNESSWSIFKEAIRQEGVSVLYRGSFFKVAQTVTRRAIPLTVTQYIVEEFANKKDSCSMK